MIVRWVLLIGVAMMSACTTGFEGIVKDNQPPQTFLMVDTIVRPAEDRFGSLVQLHWWGDDSDGWITGYEYSFDTLGGDSVHWHFTQRQDSVFLFPIPPGDDTADFVFQVRSIDNDGLRDPSPAQLTVPVKNTPPTVHFTYPDLFPVKSFPVLRYYWTGSDPDGLQTISHYELVWNDTTAVPFAVEAFTTSVVLEAIDPKATQSACKVYINNQVTPLVASMPGLLLNDTNVLFIRVVDKAEAASPWTAARPIFVKRQQADLLLIDGYLTLGNMITQLYRQWLDSIGIAAADTLQLFEKVNGAFTQQASDNFTQGKIFALFEKIIWYTNDAAASLSMGQRCLQEFFQNHGKLLMAVYVSSLFDEQSSFLDFTPIQSFVVPPDSTLLMSDTSTVYPVAPGYPTLKSTAFVGVVRPFLLVPGAQELYRAKLLVKHNASGQITVWNGVSTVIAAKSNASGKTNFILSTLELQKLNGLGSVPDFLAYVFDNVFQW